MSRALLLVKFPDDTVLVGCYQGTSDFASAWLETKEEVDKFECGYLGFDEYMQDKYPDWDYESAVGNITDECTVEIFSDYGNGTYWEGKASKEKKCITYGYFPFSDEMYSEGKYPKDGVPPWAEKFMEGNS